MSPSTEVERRKALVSTVSSDEFRHELELALPEHVSPQRFARIAYTALLDNPDLAKADEQSVYRSLLKSAADGLMPDSREAALVLFKGKAVYMPMIGGYRKIAAEHGWTIDTRVVFAGDDFDVELGDEPRVRHRPGGETELEKITAVYAVGRSRQFPTMVEVMDRAEVERIRQTSRAKDSGPWVEWWDRMAEKTVGRKLFKRLPLAGDVRVARLVNAEELDAPDAAELVYGSAARSGDVAAEAGAAPPSPVASEEEPEAHTPAEGSSELFTGEEPPDEDLLADVVLGDEFSKRAGKSIRDLVDDGDKRYLGWIVANVTDEVIVAAARAGLDELRS